MERYDFGGYATRNNLLCSDGRIIAKDAFKHNDGRKVPLVWGHDHDSPDKVLGHALLENRSDGVYAYCTFNDSKSAKEAKEVVMHGDITALSIFANNLKHNNNNVIHGNIREVSLVYAGANPGAYIDDVGFMHGEDVESEGILYTGEEFELYHEDVDDNTTHHMDEPDELKHADNEKEEPKMAEENKKEKSIQEIYDTLNDEQKDCVAVLVGLAVEEATGSKKEEENENMKHNAFDVNDDMRDDSYLSHEDQVSILNTAKSTAVGSFKTALSMYADEMGDTLQHGFEASTITALFPDYHDLTPGAPEKITPDLSWVKTVMNGVKKSPYSRIKTKIMDATSEALRGKGYKKGAQKTNNGLMKLLKRTTDPQTVYVKDELDRDDIVDITDFSIVDYQWQEMRSNLEKELATAILIGDGRTAADPDKIHEDHIRAIWTDDELYTMHHDIDLVTTTSTLQGTNTGANFGENYIWAESFITASLYSREKYKGSGSLVMFCDPHVLNVMLLARDLNGRRIYSSKADLEAALNVTSIETIEQFAGKVRSAAGGKKKKLLALFVNLKDYTVGSTKGGEITSFDDFDIDFNKYKYLIETRLSGALTKIKSAIAIEQDVTADDDALVTHPEPEEDGE